MRDRLDDLSPSRVKVYRQSGLLTRWVAVAYGESDHDWSLGSAMTRRGAIRVATKRFERLKREDQRATATTEWLTPEALTRGGRRGR